MWVCGPVRFVQLFGCRSFELRVCRTSLIFSLPPALHSQARTAHIPPVPHSVTPYVQARTVGRWPAKRT